MLVKRSFTISQHRTSVALEPEFWAAFDAAVARRATTPSALVTEIDTARDRPLASAIRTFLLAEAQDRLADALIPMRDEPDSSRIG